MNEVKIGDKIVGGRNPCYVIAEIGINHNGDMDIAKQLIDVAVAAGADAVKFQKRTVEIVYTKEELARPRENPFGPTNGDLKRGLELSYDQYAVIDQYCAAKQIEAVYKGIRDKAVALQDFSSRSKIALSRICFAGDDVNDLPAFALAGLSAAPANAQPAVLAAAKIRLAQRGGDGAVRELIELLLNEPLGRTAC